MRLICASRHPHVHPGTAAVNQIAGSLAIKGRPFATDNHSISKSHQMNIKNQHQEENRNPDYCHRDFFSRLFLPSAIAPCGDVMRFQKFYFLLQVTTLRDS